MLKRGKVNMFRISRIERLLIDGQFEQQTPLKIETKCSSVSWPPNLQQQQHLNEQHFATAPISHRILSYKLNESMQYYRPLLLYFAVYTNYSMADDNSVIQYFCQCLKQYNWDEWCLPNLTLNVQISPLTQLALDLLSPCFPVCLECINLLLNYI